MIKGLILVLTAGVSVLCGTTVLHAYPNELYIRNDSGLEIYFIADWSRDTPKTTAEYWGSLGDRVEEVLPYQVGQVSDKGHTYTVAKMSPVNWQPRPRMTGQRRPVWADYQFERDSTGPAYLIYSDNGFRAVTRKDWDELNQKVKGLE